MCRRSGLILSQELQRLDTAAGMRRHLELKAGRIERLDAGLDLLIASDAEIEVLADGFSWAEGPVWINEAQQLLFSDVPNNVIYRWSDREGLSRWLEPSGCTSAPPCAGEGSNLRVSFGKARS